MSSGSACWILWLTPMDWLALSIGRSGSQPLEYSLKRLPRTCSFQSKRVKFELETKPKGALNYRRVVLVPFFLFLFLLRNQRI